VYKVLLTGSQAKVPIKPLPFDILYPSARTWRTGTAVLPDSKDLFLIDNVEIFQLIFIVQDFLVAFSGTTDTKFFHRHDTIQCQL
jgi:hypothetical protein